MATGLRLALPGMAERGRGHIVNVCSLVARFPLQGLAGYNASKFAALGLTQSVRMEMADSGVSISAVLPSPVKTELASGIDFGLFPQVDAEDIADAIVKSVHTRAAEIGVPGYLALAARTSTLLPEVVTRPVRRLLHDDAAINRVDKSRRGAYLDRIATDD